jgi:hypothetical protein
MATITEDYVSFETARLLKEKGFHEDCKCQYGKGGSIAWISCNNGNVTTFARPTIQMTMKWLREVHNLQIQIAPIVSRHKDWTFGIYKNFSPLTIDLLCFPTYEETCEAAIKYCLENLI